MNYFRGDFIVPNFEEIWPSGKRDKSKAVPQGVSAKGMNYVLSAMEQGLPGNRDAVFTTVGKPKVRKMRFYRHLALELLAQV